MRIPDRADRWALALARQRCFRRTAESAERNAHASRQAEAAWRALEQSHQRELAKNSADLRFPERSRGPLVKNSHDDKTAIVGVPIQNFGLGAARTISLVAFVNNAKVTVEGEPIAILKPDAVLSEAFRIRIRLNDVWVRPQGKVIRLHLYDMDVVGDVHTQTCFCFYGPEPSKIRTKEITCPKGFY